MLLLYTVIAFLSGFILCFFVMLKVIKNNYRKNDDFNELFEKYLAFWCLIYPIEGLFLSKSLEDFEKVVSQYGILDKNTSDAAKIIIKRNKKLFTIIQSYLKKNGKEVLMREIN